MQPSRALEGVERMDLQTTLKVPGQPPVVKKLHERSFQGVLRCPNGCHEGGYDLATALLNAGLARHRPAFQGVVRCKGFVGAHGGARGPCPGTLEFRGTAQYAYGW